MARPEGLDEFADDDGLILTTKGRVDPRTLTRKVIFEDVPGNWAICVEWRMGDELVKRDAHVVLKRATLTATAVVGSMG